jgi:hypothetical protein
MVKFVDLTGQEFGRWKVVNYLGKSKWLCKCVCGKEKKIHRHSLIKGKSKSCGCFWRSKCVNKVYRIINKVYGDFSVLGIEKVNKVYKLKLKCKCGKVVFKTKSELYRMKRFKCKQCCRGKDLKGLKFGELKVIRESCKEIDGKIRYLCLCSCKKECIVTYKSLVQLKIISCGCLNTNKNNLIGKVLRRIKCSLCNKKIETFNKIRKFCSLKCAYKFHSKKKTLRFQILKLIDHRIKSFQM